MPHDFVVVESRKAGLNSEESYVVVRDKTCFLRVLGAEPEWSLMTATADEDHGRILACSDQQRLIEAGLRLGTELGTAPRVAKDKNGREYVTICSITRDAGQSDEGFNRENNAAFGQFFEIFDSLPALAKRSASEMRDLYGLLTHDDAGGDVYLSDGVWLSSDGTLRDRGR